MECADVSKPAPALELPNELWVEIFKNIDTRDLLELSLVCKHFNRLIFAHMAHRFRFRLSTLFYHPGVGGHIVKPERTYKHISLETSQLDLSAEFLETAKHLTPNVESLTLDLWSLNCNLLMPLLEPCTRIKALHIKAAIMEYDGILADPVLVLPAVSSLIYEVGLSRNLEKFLSSIPNVRNLTIALFVSMDYGTIQKVFVAISNSLPYVEKLHISGRTPACHTPLEELLRMKCLKELTIDELELITRDVMFATLPQVESFKCKLYYWDDINDVLDRFPNLKHLSVSVKVLFDLRAIQKLINAAPYLKELVVDMRRLTPEFIGLIQQLTSLEKLTVEAPMIAKTNFMLLRKLIVLPELRRLEIQTECYVPLKVSTTVVTSNLNCKLILNGKLVSPPVNVRRTGTKRKYPTQK